jgi:ribosome-binding ATPase YchF (GTP1/OBG family)
VPGFVRTGTGLQQLEGKTYEVADGDVLNVRFNV